MPNIEIDKIYNKGLKLIESNKLDEAKIIFEKLVNIPSFDFKANHALGIIYGSMKNHLMAKEFFEKSLKTKPDFKPSLLNLAISLTALEDYFNSEEIFNNLVKTYPDDSAIYFQLGVNLAKQKKYDEAEIKFINSINLSRSNPEPFRKLGVIKIEQKKYDEAISNFLEALKFDKGHLQTLYLLGESYYNLKNYDLAIDYLNKTISITKDPSIILNAKERIARSYDYIKEYDKSINILKEILDNNLDTKTKERILVALSCVYINSNEKDVDADYSLGKFYAEEALKINPNNITALNNMGTTNHYMRNSDESIKHYLKAHELEPLNAGVIKNLSFAYENFGLYQDSYKAIKLYKNLKPEDKILDANLAFTLLHLGKFKEAWQFYENRWNEEAADGSIKYFPDFSKPLWKPSLGYDRILIWGEQGIGDQILHGTMLEDFSNKFKKVYLAIDPKLVALFSESFPNINVYSLFDETSKDFFDYHIPLCSMGQYCRQTFEDFFPSKVHYKVKSENRFSKDKKLKCALSWKSVNGQKSDAKSTTLESLAPILKIKNIEFYNIQYSGYEEEIKFIKEKYGVTVNIIKDLDIYNDIYGLMQFIQSCDFTITTSSSNAHLSGALNIPTYLLLAESYGKFWYWDNIYKEKNIWYPSVKRFVQKEQKNWEHPINDLLIFLLDKYGLSR